MWDYLAYNNSGVETETWTPLPHPPDRPRLPVMRRSDLGGEGIATEPSRLCKGCRTFSVIPARPLGRMRISLDELRFASRFSGRLFDPIHGTGVGHSPGHDLPLLRVVGDKCDALLSRLVRTVHARMFSLTSCGASWR